MAKSCKGSGVDKTNGSPPWSPPLHAADHATVASPEVVVALVRHHRRPPGPLTSEGGPEPTRGLLKNRLLLDRNFGAAGGGCGGYGTAIVATVVRRG